MPYLCRRFGRNSTYCAKAFRVGREVIGRQVRITAHHLRRLCQPPNSCNANSGVPFCTCQVPIRAADRASENLQCRRAQTPRTRPGADLRDRRPAKLNTYVGCSPTCLLTSAIASPLSGTGDDPSRLRLVGMSTHANCRVKSTCCHCRPVTFDARKPVASENAAMSARCSGNSVSSRCASACVRARMRRVGPRNSRTCVALSSHPTR